MTISLQHKKSALQAPLLFLQLPRIFIIFLQHNFPWFSTHFPYTYSLHQILRMVTPSGSRPKSATSWSRTWAVTHLIFGVTIFIITLNYWCSGSGHGPNPWLHWSRTWAVTRSWPSWRQTRAKIPSNLGRGCVTAQVRDPWHDEEETTHVGGHGLGPWPILGVGHGSRPWPVRRSQLPCHCWSRTSWVTAVGRDQVEEPKPPLSAFNWSRHGVRAHGRD